MMREKIDAMTIFVFMDLLLMLCRSDPAYSVRPTAANRLPGLFPGQYASVVYDADTDARKRAEQDDGVCPCERKGLANDGYPPSECQRAPYSGQHVQSLQMPFYAGRILYGCTPAPLFGRRLPRGLFHWFHGCLILPLFWAQRPQCPFSDNPPTPRIWASEFQNR